ncbi:DUF2637 domain-containing protein [Pilimelia anulata]|uniref:DUF2637 domain-containing protein n=1 Tax=Pilimelia anulata TaxID=53371 RepID=UPI001E5DA8AF|nr:DUF2637 domain-containing protein [Pilimelia anulata]
MSGPTVRSRRQGDRLQMSAGLTVVGLAGIAAAISYGHMAVLAERHGEIGWRAHMFPLSVDGLEIVASIVLLADRRAGRRSGWLPWAALVAGTAASLSANVAVGGSDWVGKAVAGWPALALLLAVKLLFSLLDNGPGGEVAPDTRPAPEAAVAGTAALSPSQWVGRSISTRPGITAGEVAVELGVSKRHARRLLAAHAPHDSTLHTHDAVD